MDQETKVLLEKIITLLEGLPAKIASEHEKMMDDKAIKHAEQVLKEIEELFAKLPCPSEEDEPERL